MSLCLCLHPPQRTFYEGLCEVFGEPLSLRWFLPMLPPTLRRLHVVGEAMSAAPKPLLPSEEEIRELASARAYPPPPPFDTGTPRPLAGGDHTGDGAQQDSASGAEADADWGLSDAYSSEDDILGLSGEEGEEEELLHDAPPRRGGRKRNAFQRPPPAEAGNGSALDDPMDRVHASPLEGVTGGVAQRSSRGPH